MSFVKSSLAQMVLRTCITFLVLLYKKILVGSIKGRGKWTNLDKGFYLYFLKNFYIIII